MIPHPPPSGATRMRLGKFDYTFNGNSVSLSLQDKETAFVRGKSFSEIRVIFLRKDGKWLYENRPHLIKRKELMHEVSPTQLADIYRTVSEDWEKFWNDQTLIQLQFKKYRRYSEIDAILHERNEILNQIKSLTTSLISVNERLDSFL